MANYISDLRKLIGNRPIIYTGVTVIVRNDKSEILLQQNSITALWGTIGGALELGETFEEAAARELFEETGLGTDTFKLKTVLAGKDLYHIYPNGDEVFYATAVFEAISPEGELFMNDTEGYELKYFDLKLSIENLNPSSRIILLKAGYLK